MIVAVQNGDYIRKFKPDAKVLYSTDERVEMLEALKIVDEVVVYDTVSIEALEKIDFSILALGEDHKGGRFDEVEEWCNQNGKKVVRLKRTPGICSSDIKNQFKPVSIKNYHFDLYSLGDMPSIFLNCLAK